MGTAKASRVTAALMFVVGSGLAAMGAAEDELGSGPTLLTNPFLQMPTEDTVSVVWLTEYEGRRHTLHYGDGCSRSAQAETTELSRLIDASGDERRRRRVWRHEAVARVRGR